ncbi:MAG: hypothetical protein U0Z44_11905 [Kouleothrix sp.]
MNDDLRRRRSPRATPGAGWPVLLRCTLDRDLLPA